MVNAPHGGFDGGASTNDILEKDINLKIAVFLNNYLIKKGYKTILTRESDTALNTTGTNIKTKKVSDMQNRLKIMSDNKDAIFVSIHLNKFNSASVSGAQVFYSNNFNESLALAQNIQNSIINNLQNKNKRSVKKADKNIYLLNKAPIPAVLVECGFLSNADELYLLNKEDYQQKMAFCIFCGIIETLK